MHLFDSNYYRSMIGRANLTNSTQAPGTGLELHSQFACINWVPSHRRLSESIYESTDGQPNIGIIVYSGLGIGGPDVMKLLDDEVTGANGRTPPARVRGCRPDALPPDALQRGERRLKPRRLAGNTG